jgi:hypothetical protein
MHNYYSLWRIITAVFLSLPFNPVIDFSPRCPIRLFSRSAEFDHSGISSGLVGKVDEQSPLISAQACANNVLNALVVHGAKILLQARGCQGRPRLRF